MAVGEGVRGGKSWKGRGRRGNSSEGTEEWRGKGERDREKERRRGWVGGSDKMCDDLRNGRFGPVL